MNANRYAALTVIAFGIGMLTLIIPSHTESVGYGWVQPQSLPRICAAALILLGIVQLLRPLGETLTNKRQIIRVAVATAIATLSAYAMKHAGFLAAAPIMAGALMWLIGERRPLWLAGGIVAIPVSVWLIVVPLLGRTLP